MEIEELIGCMLDGTSLSREQSARLMDLLVSDIASDIQRGAFLSGMYFKGATTEELIGFSESLRNHAVAGRIPGVTDIVGTGGDKKDTINVSTAASIVASSLGVRIAKHGNTGITSRHGSADFMKHIGYDFDLSLTSPEDTLKRNSFLYALAPKFNQSFGKFRDVRKKIGHRTIFNLMGPITNPFDPDFLVIGTSDAETVKPLAEVVYGKGKRGYVFHSDEGLDEISPERKTRGYAIGNGVTEIVVDPQEVAGKTVPLEMVTAQDPEECFSKTLGGILGKDLNASVFIALNTAPSLVLNGVVPDLKAGYSAAMNAISSGKAAVQIQKLTSRRVEISETS